MKHRRSKHIVLIAVLAISLLLAGLTAIYWKAFVLDYTEAELRNIFKGFSVSIGARDVTHRTLTFQNIKVTKTGQECLRVGEFRMDFSVITLFTSRAAKFSIKDTVIYDRLKIPEAHGAVNYSRDVLAIGNLSARLLDGTVEGGALIKPQSAFYYDAALNLKDLQLGKVIEVFELGDKLDLTGSIAGSVELAGDGIRLTRLKGKLKVSAEGGMLTIKSQEWLDAIAGYAQTDVNVVVENFKNYRYNEGNANLKLKGTSIVMDAHLNGEAGKRDLEISLHDFNK